MTDKNRTRHEDTITLWFLIMKNGTLLVLAMISIQTPLSYREILYCQPNYAKYSTAWALALPFKMYVKPYSVFSMYQRIQDNRLTYKGKTIDDLNKVYLNNTRCDIYNDVCIKKCIQGDQVSTNLAFITKMLYI